MQFYQLSFQQVRELLSRCSVDQKESFLRALPFEHPQDESQHWLIPKLPSHEGDKDFSAIYELLDSSLEPKPLIHLQKDLQQTYFPPPNPNYPYNKELKSYAENRRLLLDELPFSIKEIHEHVRNGFLQYKQGIIQKGKGFECQRCGNSDASFLATFSCFRCKGNCVYCRSCLMMGRVSGCTPLLTWHAVGEKVGGTSHVLGWDGTLSPYQEKASQKLCDTIELFMSGKNTSPFFLIWAVCGAGKTEMLFHGVALALQRKLRVLVATPRTDVVLELEPRFKSAFPKTKVTALYGGAEDRFVNGELVISTTHQLLRFYKAFDLVIIDEVDAFPYTADKKLRYAVSQAKKERSLTVFVSATPGEKMKWEAETKAIISVKVARRYHKHPLPVPRFQWAGQWDKTLLKKRLPGSLVRWLMIQMEREKQVFLFVPRVKVMEQVVGILRDVVDFMVEGVHAGDENRREKVLDFRKGSTRILVTTTILERGVTVKGVQVAVLGAEDRIFTESALVQIAGRVGRSPDEPTGDVVYFHYGKTKEMVQAVKHIKMMNELGEREV